MALAMPQDWTDKASDEHVWELGPAVTKGRKPHHHNLQPGEGGSRSRESRSRTITITPILQ